MTQFPFFDVVIVGGGISGLCMAYALSQSASIKTALIAPKTANDTRTTAILKQHESFFHPHGVWQSLRGNTGRIKTVEIHSGDTVSRFEAETVGLDYFSSNVTNDALRLALQSALSLHSSVPLFNATVTQTDIKPDCRTLKLDNGQAMQARLVIAADGARSFLRQQEHIPVKESSYRQTASVGTVTHEKAHANVTIEFHYNGGLLTFVPLSENRRSAIVWCKSADNPDQPAMTDITGDRLGSLSDVELSDDYPLGFLQAQQLTAQRMALIGETAHKVHPLGAQGLNITLSDIQALMETIQNHFEVGLDIGSRTALGAYTQKRLRPMHTRTTILHRIAKQTERNGTRTTALTLVNTHPLLKNLITRYGMDTDS